MSEPTHRQQAEDLLALALTYPLTSPTRAVILAEANVHASLAGPAAQDVTVFVEAPEPQAAPKPPRPRKPAAPKEAGE